MALEKGCRAPQDGVIQVVAQVGDHPEAGEIHQVSAGIIEDAFQNGCRHQRKGNNSPGVLKVRRDELLQVDGVLGAGDLEKLDIA